MDVYGSEIKIPEERVPILIGKKGIIKKSLEKDFDAKIFINNDGVVNVESSDSLKTWTLEKIIKAIGRGFNPEIAFLLKKDDYDFELININDYARSQNDLQRLKGRIIGREGMSQKQIEEKTGAYIVVYGKTVGLVAKLEVIEIVLNALTMLMKGARHVTVFKYLDKENQKRAKRVMFDE